MRIISKIISKIRWHFLGGKAKAETFSRQRAINQQHCYDFPDENNGWKKFGGHPVYGNIGTGSIFDPYVLLDGDFFLMSASERNTGNLILLESHCGKEWNLKGTLLAGVPHSWESIVNRGCLLKKDGIWHLWYTGQNRGKSAIGYASGKDLTNLIRACDRPVLYPTLKEEGVSVMNPCVLWNKQKKIFQMWYSAGEDYEPDVIFYAESIDGMNWTKCPEPVLGKNPSNEWEKYKIGGCDVKLCIDGTYEMYYIAYQNLDVTRICFATSPDGINWNRDSNNLIIGPSEGAWDSDAVYKPSVVANDNVTYLWYNGRKGDNEYIGLAIRNEK